MKYVLYLTLSLVLLHACQDGDMAMVVDDVGNVSKEIATDIELYYSDSAIIQFKIIAPRRESYIEERKLIELYPEGIHIEFYDSDKNVTSTMMAPYAKRIGKDGIMTMKNANGGEVVLVNAAGDKLTTSAIQWNEVNHTLTTRKFIQLIKASTRDTSYGVGFEAQDDFSRFRILQLKGKRRYQDLTQS